MRTTPWHPDPARHRSELRTCAIDCVLHGWPVLPGTYCCRATRRWHGRPDATTMLPVHDSWGEHIVTTRREAADLWARHPYSVLLPCGYGIDAIEITVRDIPRVGRLLRRAGLRVPTVVAPDSTRRLLVRTGHPPPGTVPSGMRHVGSGEWLALPPSSHYPHQYWWYPSPDHPWELPDATAMLAMLASHPG